MTIFDRLKGSNSTTSRNSRRSTEHKNQSQHKSKSTEKKKSKKPVLQVKINLFEQKTNPSKISQKQNGIICSYGANTF